MLLSQYLEISQIVATYLVAAIGVLGLIAVLCVAWELVLVQSGRLLKYSVLHFATWQEFREFHAMKRKDRVDDR